MFLYLHHPNSVIISFCYIVTKTIKRRYITLFHSRNKKSKLLVTKMGPSSLKLNSKHSSFNFKWFLWIINKKYYSIITCLNNLLITRPPTPCSQKIAKIPNFIIFASFRYGFKSTVLNMGEFFYKKSPSTIKDAFSDFKRAGL